MNYPFPVAHGVAVTGGVGAGPTLTTSITVPPGTTLLVVKTSTVNGGATPPAVSTVKIGGVDLTHATGTDAVDTTSGFQQCRTEIWTIENPTAGTANLVTTWASTVSGELGHAWETWLNTVPTPLGTAYKQDADVVTPISVGAAPGANQVLTGVAQVGGAGAQKSDVTCSNNFEVDHGFSVNQEDQNLLSAVEFRSALSWDFISANVGCCCASAVILSLKPPSGGNDAAQRQPLSDLPVIQVVR